MKNTLLLLSLCSTALLLFSTCASRQNLNLHRTIKYTQSKFIQSFTWTGEPVRYPGTASDMHWFSWGVDDAIYVVDDDGSNFGGPQNYAHVLKITGTPPNHQVETVTDFVDYDFRKQIPRKLLRRYVNGMLAVDSILYVCLYDYDWNIPGKVWDFNDMYDKIRMYNPWGVVSKEHIDKMAFVDGFSKNGGIAGIIRSRDFGKTWDNIPDSLTPQFLGAKFAGMSFLTWGPGYSKVPAELGDYVYGISNDGNWESGDHVFMARVHRDSVLVRPAWQFYKGQKKKQPLWTSEEAQAQPIFSDPGHVGHPTMTYNKLLNRYILMIYSDTIPHRENATPEERKKWDFASELQLYESATPFGPWHLFYNEMPWGGKDHSCYLGQMPAKWFSSDGLSGYIMFAGDYVNRKGEYYGLMTQGFRMELYEK
jgi:hypothetical protein